MRRSSVDRRRRRGRSRDRRRRRRSRPTPTRRASTVARRRTCGGRRATASSRSTTCDVTLAAADDALDWTASAASASAPSSWTPTPDDDGTPFTLVVNDQPVFVQGRQLDPRRRLPAPGRPRALRAPARAGRGREPQPDPGVGRRHLRDRRLLRPLRRAGPAHLAGLPVRVRRLRRGGAAALARSRPRPGRTSSGSPRIRRSCCSPATTRTSGASRTGAGSCASTARPGARTTTTTCFPRARRRARPARRLHARAARSAPVAGATGDDLPPQRPETHGTDAPLGAVEPRGLPRPTATTGPGSSPSSAGRARPTWSTLTRVDPRRPARPRSRPGMIVHQKAMEGNVKLTDGLRAATCRVPERHGDLALGDVAQPGQRRPHRARALPLARRRTAWARSSGSSTTAGRSPRGPRSTATGAPSRCSTRSRTPSPPRSSPSSRRDDGPRRRRRQRLRRRLERRAASVRRDCGTTAPSLAEHVDAVAVVRARRACTVPLPHRCRGTADAAARAPRRRAGRRARHSGSSPSPATRALQRAAGSSARRPRRRRRHRSRITAGDLVRDLALLVDKVDPGRRGRRRARHPAARRDRDGLRASRPADARRRRPRGRPACCAAPTSWWRAR